MTKALLLAVLATLIADHPPMKTERFKAYREGAATLVTYHVGTGAAGLLHSKTVDPFVLASVNFYESRFRLKAPDGDCWTSNAGKRCASVGAMQLVKVARHWLPRMDPSPHWQGLTVNDLRTPSVSIAGAYVVLDYWKRKCHKGKGTIAQALTAYGRGRCTKRVDWQGVRRCALAVEMMRRSKVLPRGFKCGHEGRSIRHRRDRNLMRKLREVSK